MVTSTDEIMAKHCWTKIPVTRCSLKLFTCLIYKTDLIEYMLCFSSQLNVLSLENSVLTLYFKFNDCIFENFTCTNVHKEMRIFCLHVGSIFKRRAKL